MVEGKARRWSLHGSLTASMFISLSHESYFLKDTAEEGGAEELTVANVGGVFVVLISGGGVGIIVCILEMLFDIRSRANELGVSCLFIPVTNLTFLHPDKVPFVQELIGEIRFIMQCSGNTKTVNRKKSQSRGVSMDHESRSVSRSTCSPSREIAVPETYGFRPSLKNLEKLDLMPEHEVDVVDDNV